MMVSLGMAKFVYVRSPYYDRLKDTQTLAKDRGLGNLVLCMQVCRPAGRGLRYQGKC